MKAMKFLLAVVAVLLAGPVLFVFVYSIGEGCFLCMEGAAAGSAAEKFLNFGLFAFVVGTGITFYWSRKNDKDVND
jgi:hypothetical protein